MKRRRCSAPGCSTPLASYNPGPRCFVHKAPQYDAVRPSATGPRPETADAFLKGTPGVYTLTPAEAARYWSGWWLGEEADK